MNTTVRRSGREVIFKVYLQCLTECEEQELLSDINNVYQRTADMTYKSVSTIRRIVSEGNKNKGIFSTPGKHRDGCPKKDLNEFDLCAIRQKIQYFYTVRNEVPTLRNLLPVVTQELNFTGSREHLRKAVKALGYRYKKRESEKTALTEKQSIAAKRADYLEIMKDNRKLKKDIVYIDESYIDQTCKLKKCRQTIGMMGVKPNVSKGTCNIIINAGSKNGLIPNAMHIFKASNKNEMNKSNFKRWVEDKLIPNLPLGSIVVMDNAPYHSVVLNKAPTFDNKTADIKNWLTDHYIPYDENFKKPQLLMLVKRNKPETKFEVDELLKSHGHTVVRLPPCHSDLNPMELIRGLAKQKIKTQYVESIDITEAMKRAFECITAEEWKTTFERVIKIEKDYCTRELTLYKDMERLIKQQVDSSSSDSDTDYDMDGLAAGSGEDMDV